MALPNNYGTLPRASQGDVSILSSRSGGKKSFQVYTNPKTRACLDLIPGGAPPGGWYGPFGMLRIVAFLFGVLCTYSMIAMAIHISNKNWIQTSLESLLVLASSMCSLCAYSHEKLYHMTREAKKQNDLYARSLDRLEGSINGLQSVQVKLQDLAAEYNNDLDALDEFLLRFGHIHDTQVVSDMLMSFLDSKSFSDDARRGMISGQDEVEDFVLNTRHVLKRIPGIDRDTLKDLCLENSRFYPEDQGGHLAGGGFYNATTPGISFSSVKLLVNGLVRSGEPGAVVSKALSALFYFSMCPRSKHLREEARKICSPLILNSPASIQLGIYDDAGIEAEFQNCVNLAKDGAVPGSALRLLSHALAFVPRRDAHKVSTLVHTVLRRPSATGAEAV